MSRDLRVTGSSATATLETTGRQREPLWYGRSAMRAVGTAAMSVALLVSFGCTDMTSSSTVVPATTTVLVPSAPQSTVLPNTVPSTPALSHEGTKRYTLNSDTVTLKLQTGEPLYGATTIPVGSCPTRYGPETFVVVPLKLTALLDSSISTPATVKVSFLLHTSWFGDPLASSTYGQEFRSGSLNFAGSFRPYISFQTGSGPACGPDTGVMNISMPDVVPGVGHELNGYAVLPGAIDRAHPQGDPRLVADYGLTFFVSIDGVQDETGELHPQGELAIVCPNLNWLKLTADSFYCP